MVTCAERDGATTHCIEYSLDISNKLEYQKVIEVTVQVGIITTIVLCRTARASAAGCLSMGLGLTFHRPSTRNFGLPLVCLQI